MQMTASLTEFQCTNAISSPLYVLCLTNDNDKVGEGADRQCDRDLRRRIRKVPGVPLMYVVKHKYSIERLPE